MELNTKVKTWLGLSEAVKQICQPLRLMGINNFDWVRTYENGNRTRLSTQPEWVEHYFNREYYKNSQLERHPSLYQSGFSIWDYNAGKTNHMASLIEVDMRDNFNRAHGLSIIKVEKNFMDNFIFTSHKDNAAINSVYLANYLSLNKFTHYFMNVAAKLVLHAETHQISIPLDAETFNLADDSSMLMTDSMKEFNKAIQNDVLHIAFENNIVTLTKRETECLVELSRGKRIKEIGHLLKLSARTVETYLNNIKSKAGCTNLNKLISHSVLNRLSLDT